MIVLLIVWFVVLRSISRRWWKSQVTCRMLVEVNSRSRRGENLESKRVEMCFLCWMLVSVDPRSRQETIRETLVKENLRSKWWDAGQNEYWFWKRKWIARHWWKSHVTRRTLDEVNLKFRRWKNPKSWWCVVITWSLESCGIHYNGYDHIDTIKACVHKLMDIYIYTHI